MYQTGKQNITHVIAMRYRLCYDGAHDSSKSGWSEWEHLDYTTAERIAERLKFWTELNEYAVGHRGAGAKREFKVLALACGAPTAPPNRRLNKMITPDLTHQRCAQSLPLQLRPRYLQSYLTTHIAAIKQRSTIWRSKHVPDSH